jgi:hypothetical protein
LAGDWWPGCKFPPMLLDVLSCPCAIDAKGHLLVTRQAFSGPHSCVLLTSIDTCLKPPAHLDPCKGPGDVPCDIDSLRSDLGRLLMSAGDEADVALQCAGGESMRAHSQVGRVLAVSAMLGTASLLCAEAECWCWCCYMGVTCPCRRRGGGGCRL